MNSRKSKRALGVVVAGLCAWGCGTNTMIESQVTITQGLYGQLTQSCMGSGCIGAPRVGTNVAWFATNPYEKNDAGVEPKALFETLSSKEGVYEFALDSSTRGYLAIGLPRATSGVEYFTATAANIPRGLARIDWHAGPGNDGTWTDVR
ncbi:MAG: hypothetical protein JNM17_14110 [Archangium sp.]|nr:hypothetical protein [Archangium sp.]